MQNKLILTTILIINSAVVVPITPGGTYNPEFETKYIETYPASKTQSGLPAYNGYYYEFADYRLEDVDRAIVKGEYSLSLFRYTDYLEKKECMEMK